MKKFTTMKSGIYFRSNINDWSCVDELKLHHDGRLKITNVKFPKGYVEFKFADEKWSDRCNLGIDSSEHLTLFRNYILKNCNSNCVFISNKEQFVDITLICKEDGTFNFRISNSKK